MEDIDKKAREWVKRIEKQDITPPALPYEEKLVAFIDVLGVKDKVEEGGDDAAQVVDIMRQIRTYVKTECSSLEKEDRLNFLQIGDGFFIVSDTDCINEICEILSVIQWQVLIYLQMLLRGVLTAGKVSKGEHGEFFIGPAIIKALKLEGQNAIFPRIIYENKKIEEYVLKENFAFKYIEEDQDKIKYLDFLGYNIANEELTKDGLEELLAKHEVDKELKKRYEKYVCDDKKTSQKYGWLISKLAIHGIEIT